MSARHYVLLRGNDENGISDQRSAMIKTPVVKKWLIQSMVVHGIMKGPSSVRASKKEQLYGVFPDESLVTERSYESRPWYLQPSRQLAMPFREHGL